MTTTPTRPWPPEDTVDPARAPYAGPAPYPSPQSPRFRREHRWARVGGTALVVLLAAGGALAAVPDMVQERATVQRALPADLATLTIDSAAGDVRVEEATGTAAPGLVLETRWSFVEPDEEILVEDGAATLSLDCPGGTATNCWGDWVVTVPAGTLVDVRSSFGDVALSGVTGEAVVRSAFGDVRVDGAPRRVEVHGSVGDVDLALEEPPDSVDVRTSLGDVRVVLPRGTAYAVDVTTETGSPSVLVETDPASPHSVDVVTGLGSLTIEH